MPGLIKFGFTFETCVKRAIQLFTTGVPEPFIIEKYVNTLDARALEKEIHTILGNYRHRRDREFFKLNVETAFELVKTRRPDITWIEGKEYDLKYESSMQPKRHEENVIKFAETKSNAIAFKSFMEGHKWFPNKNDIKSKHNNKTEYEEHIETPLEYIDQGMANYSDAVKKKCKNLVADTMWIKNELAYIAEQLQYMKNRFECLPSETSPCACRRCTRRRKHTFTAYPSYIDLCPYGQ